MPFKALSAIYTDVSFYPWLFDSLPIDYFKSRRNRLFYLDWLLSKVGKSSYFELNSDDLKKNHGLPLLEKYYFDVGAVVESLASKASREYVFTESDLSPQGGFKPRGFWVFLFD